MRSECNYAISVYKYANSYKVYDKIVSMKTDIVFLEK